MITVKKKKQKILLVFPLVLQFVAVAGTVSVIINIISIINIIAVVIASVSNQMALERVEFSDNFVLVFFFDILLLFLLMHCELVKKNVD